MEFYYRKYYVLYQWDTVINGDVDECYVYVPYCNEIQATLLIYKAFKDAKMRIGEVEFLRTESEDFLLL